MTAAHVESCLTAAAALEASDPAPGPALVGLDGFVDTIIDVVDTRTGPDAYTRVRTIADLGARISAAAGRSTNLELVVTQTKIGGNGPIMANAMAAQGAPITVIGLLGDGGVDAVFEQMAARSVRVVSLGAASTTDALEFDDGKLMLGKHQSLRAVTYDALVAACGGVAALADLLRSQRAVATTNWTMLLGMTEIWERLAAEVMQLVRPHRPLWFADLADPAKRTPADKRRAVAALTALQADADVVLGLNETELRQIMEACGLAWPSGPAAPDILTASRLGCEALREHAGLSVVMCHLVESAACAYRIFGPDSALSEGSEQVEGFFDPKPLITTGAGDHFNAGFLSAWLRGLSPRDCLLVGGGTSACYVRSAVSPTRDDVVRFLRTYGRA